MEKLEATSFSSPTDSNSANTHHNPMFVFQFGNDRCSVRGGTSSGHHAMGLRQTSRDCLCLRRLGKELLRGGSTPAQEPSMMHWRVNNISAGRHKQETLTWRSFKRLGLEAQIILEIPLTDSSVGCDLLHTGRCQQREGIVHQCNHDITIQFAIPGLRWK